MAVTCYSSYMKDGSYQLSFIMIFYHLKGIGMLILTVFHNDILSFERRKYVILTVLHNYFSII